MTSRSLRDAHLNTLTAGLLLTALLLAPPHAVAAAPPTVPTAPAPNWYDVELIVFANTDPQAGAQESWPADPGVPPWSSAVPLKPAASGLPYMQLPASSYLLNADWKKLKRSSRYLPLLHVAWAQPAIDRASALFVQVAAPDATSAAAPAAASDTSASIAATVTATTGAVINRPDNVYGIARLSTTGPYLHFDIDLVYCGPPAKHLIASPASPAPPAATAPSVASTPVAPTATAPACQPYRLTQGRKLDAGKLNYFDNPMFGALVLVTPRSQ